MALHPPTGRLEKILAYGKPNSGKSSTWVNVAQWAARTDADIKIHVALTDFSWGAMRHDEIEKVCEVTELDRFDYLSWIDWAKKTRTNLRRQDWLVVDMIDVAWDAAQEYYWDRMTGGDLLADVYFKNAQAIDSHGEEGEYMAGAHGTNWGLVKRYYNAFLQPVVNAGCHVLVVADGKELGKDVDPAVKSQWKTGWMPAGEKHLPGFFQTILFCAETSGGWVYSTVREKSPLGVAERAMLKGAKVQTGFVMDYLVGVGGWEL